MRRSTRKRSSSVKSKRKRSIVDSLKSRFESLEDRQLLAADLASSSCGAGTCTETESFSGTPILSDAAVFDQFDTSLGTLLSVKVSLELSSDGGSFQADNDSDQPASFDVSFGAEGSISSTDVGLFSGITPVPTPVVSSVSTTQSANFNLTGTDGDSTTQFDVGGTDWDSFEGTSSSDMAMGNIGASLLGGYQGTGTFDIDYVVNQVSNTSSVGGVFRQIDPVVASGSITVTYEYEPSSNPDIEIEKTLWDINGSPNLHTDIHAGDELIYSFNITNTGDVKLDNVEVEDLLPGIQFQEQVAVPYVAYRQDIRIPGDRNLGPYASIDRTMLSDPFEAKAWDNFTLSSETVIDGISWDGAYVEPFATGVGAQTPQTDFIVEIFADDSGLPGTLLHTFDLPGGDAGVSDAMVTTTLLGHTAEFDGPTYHYDALLPFTAVAAGDYWLSITAAQTFPSAGIDPTWQWHLGSNPGGDDGFYFYDDTFDEPGDNDNGLVDGVPYPTTFDSKDLSFEIHAAELIDFDGCLHPGEMVMFMADYIVTTEDVLAGEIVNKATVTADDPNDVEVMDMDELTVQIDTPISSIEVDKYLWDINDSPVLHTDIHAGDELIYSFDVTNTGETKLTNVELVDSLPGVVMDDEVAIPYTAYQQDILVPTVDELGPFASFDRSYASSDDDPFEAKAWDNFTLSSETVIDGISWDGAYAEPFATGTGAATPETDFVVEIFGDNAGLPGPLLYTFPLNGGDAAVDDALVTTTLRSHSSPSGGPVYHYEAMLPFTAVPAGDYWLSITADQTFPSTGIDPTWQWHLGTNSEGADGFYYYDDTFDDAGDNDVGAVNGVPRPANAGDKDLSFELHAAELVDFNGMLEPGETVMFMGTYIVTPEDVEAGEIVNKATVTADDPLQREVMDMDELTVVVDPITFVELDKFLWDVNGSPNLTNDLMVGDELIYSFSVTNTGPYKLSDVEVTDPLPGLVMDDQVAMTSIAYEQTAFIPADGNLGPFASVDRSYEPRSDDPFEAKAWDNFTLSDDIVLDAVSFTGAYVEPFSTLGGEPETDFLIEIYGDDAGLPGTSVFSFLATGGLAGVDDANVRTRLLTTYTAADGGPVYEYDAMLPFTVFEAGDYWISITAVQTFPSTDVDPTWQWHLGTNSNGADGSYYYDDTFDDAGDNDSGAVNGIPRPANANEKDLAFTLHASELVDFDGMLDPGETAMFMGTYYVTQEDINNRGITNEATVTATLPDGTVVSDSDEFYYAITTPIEQCVPSPGDADGDGTVDFPDFLILSSNFNEEVDSHTEGDFNCDGIVDFADFLILSGNFGKTVPINSVAAAAAIDDVFGDDSEDENWVL